MVICFILAALCIALAIAVYYNDEKIEEQRGQGFLEDICDIPHCPYCGGIDVVMYEDGNCFCYECEYYWNIENTL